ncbi:MAG: sulfatase-like hydrolase/transferase [Verrucomicrobiae bacterium]|nr:sulfatase-like hydrolase/transferase [Verrucomicrobiae bacterium]
MPTLRLFSLAALCLSLLSIAGFTPADERPPNIIYIMTDDLGYGDLGCYGQETVKTPNVDRMAEEGLRFTDHYAGHTVCRPSRLVLWTGKHVGHTGLIGNRDRMLTGTEHTVARLLQDAGYATGGVGKWALGNVEEPSEVDNPGHPNHNGFDSWFGYLNQGTAHNFYPPFLWDNKEQFALSGNALMTDNPQARGRVSEKRETYSHDTMTDRAFAFIRRHHEQPFLLHIHWTIPHANNEGGRVLGDGMEVPDYGIYADKDWPNPEKGFAAMVTRMDGDVGRLFGLLKELGIDEQTLVLFTSDNGAHQEGNHEVEFFDSNGPLQGFKRSMHEGGIRVPMIARWPGKVEAGTVTDHPSAFWDFLPTACEIAGVEPPVDTDGISYLPTLLGKPDEQEKHVYLYWASSEGATSVGIRQDNWKLVKYRANGKKNKGETDAPETPAPDDWRLYDLSQDISEANNVAAQHPDRVQQMLAMVREDELAGFEETDHPVAPVSAEDKVVVALVGDSTVTDSSGWGKAFAGKFRHDVEVKNFAMGGRSAKSWLAEDRLPAALEAKPDYVFIQFGHNGQPGKGPERETDPATTYRDYLRQYVTEFRAIGAEPIIVSSVTRRDFTEDGTIRTEPTADDVYGDGVTRPLKPWAEAAKAVAEETGAPFIDLYQVSVAYHNHLGETASWDFSPKENDITHFNELGAEAIANLIVDELRKAEPKLAKKLK